jgi:hypothetical protein
LWCVCVEKGKCTTGKATGKDTSIILKKRDVPSALVSDVRHSRRKKDTGNKSCHPYKVGK